MTSSETPSALTPAEPSRLSNYLLPCIEALVLIVLLTVVWKAWSAWPLVPFADNDTWGYINPALTWLSGLGFQQTDGRDWFYPALLALFLKTTGSFAGIAAGQKFLGLCAGLCMAIAWRCWVSLLPLDRWLRFLLALLGAWPIYYQLVNEETVFFMMSLRPEAVLPFFVYAQLACVMAYCKYRWQTPRCVPAMALGIAAIVLAYGCLVLKPSWYFATVTTSLPVAIGFFGRALPRWVRLGTPILGTIAALLVFSLPARFFVIRDAAATILLPDALLCVHAEFIERDLSAKLAKMPQTNPEKARLREFVSVLNSEIHNAKSQHKVYEKLGFNADYLMHSDTLSHAITDYAGDARGKFRAFCYSAYFSAVWHQPWAYTRKVLDQFTHFLFPLPKTFFDDQTNLTKAYRDSAVVWNESGAQWLRSDVREMYAAYRRQIDAHSVAPRLMAKYPELQSFRQKVAACALAVELLFLVALAASVVWTPLRRLSLGGWAAFFLFLAPAGNAFGVCIVHTLDIHRYRVTYGGYLLFSLAAMAIFVALVVAWSVFHFIARRRDTAVE